MACPSMRSPGKAGSSRLNDSIRWSMIATVHPSPARREATAEPTRPHPTTTACTSNSPSPVYRRQERSAYHHDPMPLPGTHASRSASACSATGRSEARWTRCWPSAPRTSSASSAARSPSCARSCATPGARAHASAAPGLLTESFEELRDDPRVSVVAEVMGGIDPTRGYISDLLESRHLRGLGQQAAARAPRRGAVGHRGAPRRPAALRGIGVRRDPGREGAARVDAGRRRARGHRHRQRHDQLHPDRDDAGGPGLRRGARAGPGARVRRGRPDRGRERRGRRGQDGDPRLDRVPRARAHRPGAARGHRHARPRRRQLRAASSATRSSCSVAPRSATTASRRPSPPRSCRTTIPSRGSRAASTRSCCAATRSAR